MKRRTKTGIIILCLSLAGLLYANFHFYYNTFYKPAHLFSDAVKNKPFDVIIVPGISYNGCNLGLIMKSRIYWSVFLYKAGITKNVIYSGGAVYTPYREAVIMALYAEKMGVPKEHIFTETQAEHTTENLYYSWQLAKAKGFRKIAFATDPFQSMKTEPYIKEFHLDVSLLPMVLSFMQNIPIQGHYDIESYKAYKTNFIHIDKRETKKEQEFYSKGGRVRKMIN